MLSDIASGFTSFRLNPEAHEMARSAQTPLRRAGPSRGEKSTTTSSSPEGGVAHECVAREYINSKLQGIHPSCDLAAGTASLASLPATQLEGLESSRRRRLARAVSRSARKLSAAAHMCRY